MFFHLSLTRASLETDLGGSELSAVAVAVILRDYVVRFFSCADCKFHFGRMSARLEKFLETDRDAVLWFWTAHNKVPYELCARDMFVYNLCVFASVQEQYFPLLSRQFKAAYLTLLSFLRCCIPGTF